MTLRLSLVIDGDAGGARKAAVDATAGLGDMRKAAAVTSTAIKKASDDNITSLGRLRTEMERTAAGQAAAGVRVKSLMQGINESRGLGAGLGGDRGADIAAYGQELDRLRAKFDPVFAAGQRYKATLAEINTAARVGALSEGQRAEAIRRTKDEFAAQVVTLRGGAAANAGLAASTAQVSANSRQARAEMINLSRQVQDVGVGFASGQSPFLILTQQGSQIADVFASSERSIGDFAKQAVSGVLSFLSPAKLAAGAILGIGIAALTAAVQFGDGQRQIDLALTGIGRASGLMRSDVNQIARDSASAFGLSVSEARGLATQLSATGKIGRENIAPIVSLGHEVAVAFGTDAAGAAKLLADAFADPVKGVDTLNQRLGFLDAATQRQLANLQAQNRLYEAQALLQARLKSGLAGIDQGVTTSTRFWTAIGNAISNAWDAFGNFASRATGIGFTEGLDEKLARSKGNIEALQRQIESLGNGPAVLRNPAALANLEKQLKAAQVEYGKLTQESDRYWTSVAEAQARQQSFAPSAAVRGILPEIDQLQKLRNENDLLARTMINVQTTGGSQSEVLRRLGITYEQLSAALARSTANLQGFKSEAERTAAGLRTQIDAVSARSPAQKGDIAFRQSLIQAGQNAGTADKETLGNAELARTLAIQQAQFGIAEAQRQQLLSAQQRVESANLEISILGRGSIEQERQRALLQAKQQVEQDALRNYGSREAYDRGHLAALEAQLNAEYRIKQALADQQLARDLTFERSQIGRTPDEQQIASRLRGIYGDQYESQLNGAEAAQMRLNQQLQFTHDLGLNAYKGILNDLQQGKKLSEAFGNAVVNQLSRIIDKAAEASFSLMFPTGSGSTGGLLSLFSLFGFDDGGYTGNRARDKVAGVVHGQEFVVKASQTARHLPLLQAINEGRVPGYAGGGYVGSGPPRMPGWINGPAADPRMVVRIELDNEMLRATVRSESNDVVVEAAPGIANMGARAALREVPSQSAATSRAMSVRRVRPA